MAEQTESKQDFAVVPARPPGIGRKKTRNSTNELLEAGLIERHQVLTHVVSAGNGHERERASRLQHDRDTFFAQKSRISTNKLLDGEIVEIDQMPITFSQCRKWSIRRNVRPGCSTKSLLNDTWLRCTESVRLFAISAISRSPLSPR